MAIKSLNPSAEAIIDKKFRDLVPATSYPYQMATQLTLSPTSLMNSFISTSAGTEKLIVFSEIYYPAGWKCYVMEMKNPICGQIMY